MASSGGTLRWQAPELLMYEGNGMDTQTRNSLASDIYAFACVCYEVWLICLSSPYLESLLMRHQIFVGHPPFHELMPEYRVISAVVNGNRPPRPSLELRTTSGFDDAIWDLINKCWRMIPSQRPSAHDVVRCLSSRRNPPPACDWDEAIMSRLHSTLAGHPWSRPAYRLEGTQGLDSHDTFNTQPPSSAILHAPSRVVTENCYENDRNTSMVPIGKRTPGPTPGRTPSPTSTTRHARHRTPRPALGSSSSLISVTRAYHRAPGPAPGRKHFLTGTTPRARYRGPSPTLGSKRSLTSKASCVHPQVVDENYSGGVIGALDVHQSPPSAPSPLSLPLPVPIVHPSNTYHDRSGQREGTVHDSGPNLKRAMDDPDTSWFQKKMRVDSTSPAKLAVSSDFAPTRQLSSSQLHNQRANRTPENALRGMFRESGIENISPPARLCPDVGTENRFDLIGVQITYTSKKKRLLRFL